FTQNPSAIEVSEGAALDVNGKDIEIDTTNALLELKGADAGINAVDANVNIKGDTNISGETGIIANNSNVTMAGGSKIIGRGGKAISALGGGKVRIDSNLPLYIRGLIYARSGQIYLKGGNGSNIEGDLEASDGGEVDVNLSGDGNVMWGAYRTDENSCVKVYVDEGATWNLTDGEDETKAEGKSLLRMAKGAAAPETGLVVKGGATDKQSGFLNMTNRSKTLDIAHYSGWETVIYEHKNAGADVADYTGGDTVIAKADKDSGVILSTDNSGITMNDKSAVEATLAALAQKVTYKDHEANGANLTGKVQIAEGLTSSSASQYIGKLHWDANGVGQYDKDSVNWKEIYNGDYETLVMKGVRSAATTSMHSWRDNMQDTYTGADLADEDGIFAKALGGKTSSDVKGVKDDNTYRGVQVGFDKALANGWHAGVAFDYRDGDSNYLLGGKGDNQLYSLGVYGVKSFDDQSYLRVAAKAGRVENEY
ncbi:autotransporter outer membrane beta-barrel domain-containing protein, partial [Phascolarctobacterium succinatutens]|uniref:autotransporter outer membrane beta-barrel domain-containing protein n=1 Tax=Phascolarctobacterium succinatutens TaxID=626940 RepID=UPI0026EA4611